MKITIRQLKQIIKEAATIKPRKIPSKLDRLTVGDFFDGFEDCITPVENFFSSFGYESTMKNPSREGPAALIVKRPGGMSKEYTILLTSEKTSIGNIVRRLLKKMNVPFVI